MGECKQVEIDYPGLGCFVLVTLGLMVVIGWVLLLPGTGIVSTILGASLLGGLTSTLGLVFSVERRIRKGRIRKGREHELHDRGL